MNTDTLWRAVSDPTRRRIIELLRDGPQTTGELCRGFSTTRFAVMKHLAVLERCGVVKVSRSGRQRWNALDPEPLGALESRWPRPGSTPQIARAFRPAPEPSAPATSAATREPETAELRVFIDAPPWRVFDALTMNVGSWWGAPHLVSPEATGLVLEPQPGGRFYEEWGHRQGALRGLVAAIKQDERLALTGAVFGAGLCALGFVLDRREGGTLVSVSIAGAGCVPAARGDAAAVLDDLVRTRLKAFVEQGTRSGVAP
jgi:DNA-binding transcriptional ArsR family regulator